MSSAVLLRGPTAPREGEIDFRRIGRTMGMIVLLVVMALIFSTDVPATTILDEPAHSEIVLTGPVDEWAIGGGFVYWASCCDNVVECSEGGFLKRRALLGDLVEILEITTVGTNTDNFRLMAADDVGVVYYDATQGAIEMRHTESADIATSLHSCDTPDTRLRIHGDYVYWGASDGIWRSRLKPPLGTERMEYLEVGIDDIAVDDHGVYALVGGGLYLYPFSGPTEQLWAGNGTSLLLHDSVPYWVGIDASGNQSIYRRLVGGGTSPVHYGGEGVDIHNVATDGESVFWVDSTTTDDTLQRKAINTPASAPPDAIDYTEELFPHPADRRVHATDLHLYYFIRETPFALRRITFDAAPLARDLAFQAS